MNKSSIEPVKDNLDILTKIQKVDAPDDLLDRVVTKLNNSVNRVVPMFWVKSAAAAILLLIIADLTIIYKNSQGLEENSISSLVNVEDYQLYND